MLYRAFVLAALTLIFALSPGAARAQQETPIKISVVSGKAGNLGNSMGGAQITIRDKVSGDVLASGPTHDGGFEVAIDLPKPTMVTITASGPMAQTQGLVSIAQDFLLIAGNDYAAGDGIVLAMPGAIVDVTGPAAGQSMTLDPDKDVLITANVMEINGAAAASGRYVVEAHIYVGSMPGGKAAMTARAQPGEYAAKARFPKAGTYTVIVTAFDPDTKEGGMDQTTVTVLPDAAPKKLKQ